MDENLANFEDKTQRNFEINEQAIKDFTKYLNGLDARQVKIFINIKDDGRSF